MTTTGGEDSDSDSSLDIEKWRRLALELTGERERESENLWWCLMKVQEIGVLEMLKGH